jgi:hypothetical protein
MAWTPENGFLTARWDTYSELMMLYLLKIGSPTTLIPAGSWQQIARPTLNYYGLTYITTTAPLFIHQYSHAWFDSRSKQDAYADYFNNSVTATRAQSHGQLGRNVATLLSSGAQPGRTAASSNGRKKGLIVRPRSLA